MKKLLFFLILAIGFAALGWAQPGQGQGQSFSVSTSSTQTCKGQSNGTITVTVSGRTGYVALGTWSSAVQVSSSKTYTGLAAGSYTVYYSKNQNSNNPSSTTVTVSESDFQLTITDSSELSCYRESAKVYFKASGGSTASGYLSASSVHFGDASYYPTTIDGTSYDGNTDHDGFFGDYYYYFLRLDPSQNKGELQSINYGTCSDGGSYSNCWTFTTNGRHTVTSTDNDGCTSTVTFIKPGPMEDAKVYVSTTPASGTGKSDGTATVSLDNSVKGFGTYTYSFDGNTATTTASASGLAAGMHTVTVTDECSNSYTKTFYIPNRLDPGAITFNITRTSEPGATDGKVEVSVASNAGVAPYTYSLDGSSYGDASVFNGLKAGEYTVYVKDANGTVVQKTFTVCQKLRCVVDSKGDVTCYGQSTGTITVDVANAGGYGEYKFKLNKVHTDWQESPIFQNLPAGEYVVTIYDTQCGEESEKMADTTVTIAQPDALIIPALADTSVCPGSAIAIACPAPQGGNAGTGSYIWSVTGADTNFITAGQTSQTVTVKPTDENITATLTVTYKDSKSCTATQTAKVLVKKVYNNEGVKTNACDSYVWNGVGTYTTSGKPSHTFTAVNGCDSVVTLDLTIYNNTSTAYDTTVYYTYKWAKKKSTLGHGNNNTYTASGDYVGSEYTTANGCKSYDTLHLTVNTLEGADGFAITHVETNPTGYGRSNGKVDITVTAPSDATLPFKAWKKGNSVNPKDVDDGSVSFDGYSDGTYTVYVAYSTLDTFEVTFSFTQPEQLGFDLTANTAVCKDSSATLAVTNVHGGVGSYTYAWSVKGSSTILSSASSMNVTPLAETTYQVKVSDTNDNTLTKEVKVSVNNPAHTAYTVDTFYTYTWNALGHGSDATYQTIGTNTYVGNRYQTAQGCDSYDTLHLTLSKYDWQGEDKLVDTAVTRATGFGRNDGSVQVVLDAPMAGNYYAWLDTATGANVAAEQTLAHNGSYTFTNLYAGTYSLKVRYEQYDTVALAIVVGQPALLTFDLTENTAVCKDSSTTLAITNVQGGVAPYNYNWRLSDPEMLGFQTTQSIETGSLTSELTWIVTVSDANHNSAVDSVTVSVNNPAHTAYTVDTFYTYTWNALGHGSDATYQTIGTNTYVGNRYQTAQGCDSYDTLHLTLSKYDWQGEDKLVDTTVTNAMGFGRNDGSVKVALNAPMAGNYYAWLDTATGANVAAEQTLAQNGSYTFTNLYAGTYSLNVRYEQYDTVTLAIVVDQPALLTFDLTENTAVCKDSSTTLTITNVQGGVAPYTYNWRLNDSMMLGFRTTQSIETGSLTSELTWIVTVSDANHNSAVDSVTVSVNNPTHTAYTQEAFYTYTWNTPGNGDAATHQTLGTNTYVGNVYQTTEGCDSYDTLHLTINEYDWSDVVTDSVNSTTGYGRADGSFTAKFVRPAELNHIAWLEQNGVKVQDEKLFGASGNYNFTGLAAGNYTFKLRCQEFDTVSINFVIEQPDSLVASANADTAVCPSVAKQLSATAQGGTAPYTYSWMNKATREVLASAADYLANPAATTTYIVYVTDKYSNIDSATVTVAVKNAPVVNVDSSRCDNDLAFTWNGVDFTTTGTKTATLVAANACDSVVNMTLKAYPTYNEEVSLAVVENVFNTGYLFRDTTFNDGTTAGTYTFHRTTAKGCDSTVTLDLAIYENISSTVYDTACDLFLFTDYASRSYSVSHDTTIVDTRKDIHGADSVVSHLVKIYRSYNVNVDSTICADALPLMGWNGKDFAAAGSQSATLTESLFGCDSVVNMTLHVNDVYAHTVDTTVCDLFVWTDGSSHTATLDSVFNYSSQYGCDSVVTLNLVVNYNSNAAYTDTAYYTYTWDAAAAKGHGSNSTFTAIGSTMHLGNEYVTAQNCPSVDTLYLTLRKYDWAGNGYIDTLVVDPSGFGIADGSCQLTLNAPLEGNYYAWLDTGAVNIHNMTRQGNTTFEGLAEGEYTMLIAYENYDTFQLVIRVAQPPLLQLTLAVDNNEICDLQSASIRATATGGVAPRSFQWKEANTGSTATLLNATGVAFTGTNTDTTIYSNTASPHATTTYRVVVTDANGIVDSADITIVVNPVEYSYDNVETCDSLTWIDGNTYYNDISSIDPLRPSAHFTTALHGCDSTRYLSLTVYHTGSQADTAEAYYNYKWTAANGLGADSNLTATGTYYGPQYMAEGKCPSVDTLRLTINTIVWDTVFDTNVVKPTEYGDPDGKIELDINSPAAGNYYAWIAAPEAYKTADSLLDNPGTFVFPNLPAGDYTLCVRYETYDTTFFYIHIDQPEGFGIAFSAANDTTCLGIAKELGTDITTNGDTATFTYAWFVAGSNEPLATTATYIANPDTTTTYQLVVVNAINDTASAQLTLVVNNPVSQLFNDTAYYTYTWNTLGHGDSVAHTATGIVLGPVYQSEKGCDSRDTLALVILTNNWTDTSVLDTNITLPSGFDVPDGEIELILDAPAPGDYYICLDTADTPNFLPISNPGSMTFDSLPAGDYTVLLVYSPYDTIEITIHVDQPEQLVAIAGNDTAFCGHISHILQASATGGTGEVSYIWKSLGATDTLADLASLNVEADSTVSLLLVATDANNIQAVDTVVLTYNQVYNYTVDTAACDTFRWSDTLLLDFSLVGEVFENTTVAGCDSIITLNLTIHRNSSERYDAEGYYTFVWNDTMGYGFSVTGNDTLTADSLYIGRLYNDANGCASVDTLDLNILTLDSNTFHLNYMAQNPTGYGANNGYINVEIGTPSELSNGNYIYWLDGVNVEDTASNLTFRYDNLVAGSYTVYVRYEEYDTFQLTVTLANPEPLKLQLEQLGTICYGADDTIGINYTNGNLKHYAWYIAGTTDTLSYDNYLAIAPTENTTYVLSAIDTFGFSISDTLTVSVYRAISQSYLVEVCDSFQWDNRSITVGTFDSTGIYYDTYNDANECQIVDTLYLSVFYSKTAFDTAAACDQYDWNDTTFTLSGDYEYADVTYDNCDSIAYLNLTMHYADSVVDNYRVCDSLVWQQDSITYFESNNTARVVYQDQYGCDSIYTLSLEVFKSYNVVDSIHACDSFMWIDSAMRYADDFFSMQTLHTVDNGCDSIVSLNLTMGYTNSAIDNKIVCDYLEWNGRIYSEPTDSATYTTLNASGCDSTVTLHLEIRKSSYVIDSGRGCDEYYWYRTDLVYTHSTDLEENFDTNAYISFTNQAGCDSAFILILDLGKTISDQLDTVVCDSLVFDWYGIHNTYTSTTKTNVFIPHTDEYACDTVIRVNVTVKPSARYDFFVSSDEESYTWNERTYNRTGDYAIRFDEGAANGCDSVVTLHLVITGSSEEGIDDANAIEVRLYPNPTTGRVTIDGAEVAKIEVIDLFGRKAAEFTGVNSIDIANLPAGSYTLRITTPQGTALQRIVKK